MRIWLACFGVLFAIAELYQWAKHLSLPLPVFILGGGCLAIASNYKKLVGSFLNTSAEPVTSSVNLLTWDKLSQSQSNSAPQPAQPVAFTIKRSSEGRE